jgi:PPOX class probable F420-dependent enzyme
LSAPAVVQITDVHALRRGDTQVMRRDVMASATMERPVQRIERPVQRPAADLEARFPGRYLSVTSFRRDGTGVATPLWFVSDGRRLFALTDLHSAKVRRMRRNPRVLVASCRVNGKLRGEPVAARVKVLSATPELDRVQKLLIARYKISSRLVMLFYRLGRRLRRRRSVADGAALAITVE